jgi:hypothetical protein
VVIPIVVLLSDFISSPATFENKPAVRTVNLMLLLAAGKTKLGVFRAHDMFVSVDDLAAADYLADLRSSRNALVLSGFKDEDNQLKVAALGGAIIKKLQSVSPVDHDEVLGKWSQKSYIRPGEVLVTELRAPPVVHKDFPLDALYTIIFTDGQSISSNELTKGLTTVLELANEHHIQNLILPCLGRNWEHSKDSYATAFSTFFSSSFAAVQTDSQSPAIYLSLYKEWPSFELEDAVGNLNSEWGRVAFGTPTVHLRRLYRVKHRATILAWFLCLLVCSFVIFPGVKNFLIITVAFLTMALASDELVRFLTEGRPSLENTLHYVVLAVLAVAFPAIAAWDPKDLFKSRTSP